MPSLPRFHLSGEKRDDTQAELNPAQPAASWSGYPPHNDDELVGMTLNDTYVVESLLGEGGMGRVYRASHTRITNKRFAIKVLRPEFTRNIEVVARFRREAEAAACIAHPNVVEVFDVDETVDGFSYLVCEYLAGLDLSEFLIKYDKLGCLPAVNVALQLCRALEAAHSAGVVHRDVKPHNVFLLDAEDGSLPEYPAIKVLDFGLSRFMDAAGTQLTRAGVIMGTPSYMSPEQAEGRPVDVRTDVYGVGAVLFAALTGHPPYEADTIQALVLAVINQEPVRPRNLNPEIPENLELIVQRAMARVPDERYQTMADLRLALQAYYDRHFAALSATDAPARPAAPSMIKESYDDENVATARPRLLVHGAALTLLAAVGLGTSWSSIELWTGRLHLSKVEALLLTFGVIGTLLTPALLLLRRLKKAIWNSHAKVLALLADLRVSVILGLVAFGLSALTLHVLDDVVARFLPSRMLGVADGSGFRGFNLVLFLVGATWTSLSLVRHWGERRPKTRLSEVWLVLLGLLLSAGLLYAGLFWRAHTAAVNAAVEAAERHRLASENATAAEATAPANSNEVTHEAKSAAHASIDELTAANAKGIPGLLPLAERYPEDPEVLRPLLYAFASRATGLADAMATAGRLLKVAPEDARDSDLRYLVRKAATSPGEASRIAFELMSDSMGTTGPDLLYDLFVAEPRVARQAELLLNSPKVQMHFSPALAVAYDLRRASTCASRVALLARAAALGDRRSVAILSPLSASSKRGCGRFKRSPCLPACPEEARAYLQTITKILERQPSSR
jgi:serine/threonine protein kinase